MPRYFIELSYRGTHYSGFQIQQNAQTIQSEVEKAMSVVCKEKITLTGSSRTDAGVHAHQNFFHFDINKSIQSTLSYNLNALLPHDIVVNGIYNVPPDAHARFDATAREYKYYLHPKKNPFLQDIAWWYPYLLQQELLQQAANLLLRYNEFTSFCKRNSQANTHICNIEFSKWYCEGTCLVYHVKANRFLRGMVRALVGTMLKVGRGKIALRDFENIIIDKDATQADFSTPPHGLFLENVHYPTTLLLCDKQHNLSSSCC